MRIVVAAAVALGMLVISVGGLVGFFLVSETYGSCTEEERKVYEEFPHYGNTKKVPQAFVHGGCSVSYDTRASQEQVARYYTERLEARGWEVEQRKFGITFEDDPHAEKQAEGRDITARRGDFFYSIMLEPLEMYVPPRAGVRVDVRVNKDEDAPPPCGSKEKATLAEFPHYGGKVMSEDLTTFTPPNKPKGACATTYPAEGASQKRVLSYYEAKLTEHGWQVKRFSTKRGGRIEGSREGLRYVVHYSRFPEEHATDIRVEVYRG
jgi:hypothetical protein